MRSVMEVLLVLALLAARAHADEPKRPTPPDSSSASQLDPGPLPDVEGIGVLGIARHDELRVDASFAHSIDNDAFALVPSARLHVGRIAFLDGTIPVGYGLDAKAAALGNVMIAAGLLPESGRLAGIALRFAAPTSPSVGSGMTTVAALAGPRNADPELFLPHTTSAELVADWRWRGASTWLVAEAGLAGWWQPARYESVLRTTLAGGVRVTPWLDLAASLVTRIYVTGAPTAERFVHSLCFAMIAHHRRGQLALRLEVPIDESARQQDRFLVGLELRGR